MAQRPVTRVTRGVPTSDGAGVKLTRVIGNHSVRNLDPFMLLDEFRSDVDGDYIAGFPAHPHRGFETVTYMLAGNMKHQDSVGNTGFLGPGSVQWMTAGRGIIHSEMPEQEDGLMWGFQLWVNLPAAHKMDAPRYQDIPATDIPTVELDGGVRVKVVAGEHGGTTGPVQAPHTDARYLDVTLPAGTHAEVALPDGHQGFVYVFEGSARAGGRDLARGELGTLGERGVLKLSGGAEGGRLLVVAGAPIHEPIVQYGPFVMNTEAEIRTAIADYQSGRLGR